VRKIASSGLDDAISFPGREKCPKRDQRDDQRDSHHNQSPRKRCGSACRDRWRKDRRRFVAGARGGFQQGVGVEIALLVAAKADRRVVAFLVDLIGGKNASARVADVAGFFASCCEARVPAIVAVVFAGFVADAFFAGDVFAAAGAELAEVKGRMTVTVAGVQEWAERTLGASPAAATATEPHPHSAAHAQALAQLLAASDGNAQDYFDANADALKSLFARAEFQRFEKAIQDFDFEAALALLEAATRIKGSTLGETTP